MEAVALSRDALTPVEFRVERVQLEAQGVVSLDVAPCSGARPGFRPGQFNMLYAFGIGEVAISISGGARDGGSFVHTIRQVGAASTAIARMRKGEFLGLRGPFGIGWPIADAQGLDVIVVAGGLGLAPLRPAIQDIMADRERYGQVAILVGCRSPIDILFRGDIERWRKRRDVQFALTVDHASADWRGHVGVAPALISAAAFDPDKAIALVCGPEVMMRFTASALMEAGIPPERIYLSLERNMKCAVGLCGRCQFGPDFICKDGPVMRFDRIAAMLTVREI